MFPLKRRAVLIRMIVCFASLDVSLCALQVWIQPEVEGAAARKEDAQSLMESKPAEGARKPFGS